MDDPCEPDNMVVDEDKEKAVQWLGKATEQGHEDAKKVLEQVSLDTQPKHLMCYICLRTNELVFMPLKA
jgi:TPR repeat protein